MAFEPLSSPCINPDQSCILLSFAPASGIGFYSAEGALYRLDIVAEENVKLADVSAAYPHLHLEFDQVQFVSNFSSYRDLRSFVVSEYLRDKKNTYYTILFTQALDERTRLQLLSYINDPVFKSISFSEKVIPLLEEIAKPHLIGAIIEAAHSADLLVVSECLRTELKDIAGHSSRLNAHWAARLVLEGGPASLIILLMLLALVLASLGKDTHFPRLASKLSSEDVDVLLRRLCSTILVYFMQLGFIAFEAGEVRQNYRRQSAVKNLIVFAVSFWSYLFIGWHIQGSINHLAFASPLDVAFNAGFASTVALIIANTITERGTLLVNSICSILAAGFAYPIISGLLFIDGPFANSWRFVDSAGGCVVHLLGAALALSAALWLGPRSRRRVWLELGRVQMAEQRDNIHLTVIGAFFLWFGWLGFNSGNAKDWNDFLTAFLNTSVGASAGGLVGLTIALASRSILSMPITSTTWRGEVLRDVAGLERVVFGMMGGLVAVTANASYIKPSEALLEAILGAISAVVGSAVIARGFQHRFQWLSERLDDPLGAIATHGFAGAIGVLFTPLFRPDLCSLPTQALGCALTVVAGMSLCSVPFAFIWFVEKLRGRNELWLYSKLFRLTTYEQQTGKTGTEFWDPVEDIERARERLRAPPALLPQGRDQGWIDATGVLALSEEPSSRLKELFSALQSVLETSFQGSAEERAALTAIRARGDFGQLPMCVKRVLAHREAEMRPVVREWNDLEPRYKETLIVTISELAASFAVEYRVLRVIETHDRLAELMKSFVIACDLLEKIGLEEDTAAGRLSRKSFLQLMTFPLYWEIRLKAELGTVQ